MGTLVVGLLALAMIGTGCIRTPGPPGPTAAASPTAAPPSPKGTGHAAPEGLSCPPGHPTKGDLSPTGERFYHVPGGANYDQVKPDECLATETDAQAAGYRRSER